LYSEDTGQSLLLPLQLELLADKFNSQGTAVMHSTVGALPANLKQKVVGGVLFGDTKNSQDRSQVPNYPKDKVQVYCAKEDGVCWGILNVTNGHFVYTTNGDGTKAIEFLKGQIDAATKRRRALII
jgi:cutinase